MTYEEMINEVCAGKTAFLTTKPDMVVFREGDTIIRRTFRKCEINQIFIASVQEINSHDWDIVEDSQEADVLHVLDVLAVMHPMQPGRVLMSQY